MNRFLILGGVALLSVLISAAAQELLFDFEDGTTQGWTTVSSDPDLPHAFTPTNEASENGSTFPVPAGGDYQVMPLEFENADGNNTRDGAHRTLLTRSPEFMLVEGELSIAIVGGDAHGALPAKPSDLAESTDGEGVHAQGFGLRRVSDDSYVVTGARSTNDDIYQTIVVPAAELAEHVSDTETYTVDVFDSSSGGWGWIAFDEVKVPGKLPPSKLIYDFEDGTAQGWTNVSSDPDLPHAFTPTNEQSENGETFPVPASGDYQVLPLEFENADGNNTRDGAHQTLLTRSPEFLLESGELSIAIVGGDAHGALPEKPADLAERTDTEGIHAQGFGLRRVSDDSYVVTGARSTNDDLYQEVLVSAEDLAPFVSDTETYTVDVFDSSAGGWGWIAFDNVQIPGRLPPPKVVFDFEDGTTQGWTTVSSDPDLPHAFTPTNESSENGETFPVPASGDYQVLPLEFENADGNNTRDGAHQTLLTRSPEFLLGEGELSIAIVGGDAHGALPEKPEDLAESTDGEGVHAQGFGLRRVSDDSYVVTGARSTNDDLYQNVVVSAAELAPFVSDTETYTVDVFDSSAGGWGWIAFDNVVVPGSLVQPSELVFDFEDGTTQGWTTVSSDEDLPHKFTPTNEQSENGETFPVPASGDYQVLPLEFENEDGNNTRDGAHQTLLTRSPEFFLAEGELAISIVGGDAHGALPDKPDDLAERTDTEGIHAQGFGLRRVSDDSYVVTGARSTNDDIYQEIVIPAEDLAEHISNTETYTIDVFDSSAGGWGWIAFDNVKVSGRLVNPLPPVNPGFTDNDNDGMDDAWETTHELDTDENDSGEDPDNDGLTNLEEFQLRTFPKESDTDEDGLDDGVETKTGVYVNADDTGTHPLRRDTDFDGLDDGVENPGIAYDPSNPLEKPGTSPVNADTDGDGALDGLEAASDTDPTVAGPLPSNIEGGGVFLTTNIWTNGNLEITDSFVVEEILADPEQDGFVSIEAETPFINFHDNTEPPVFLESSRPYPLWDNENDGFGDRDNFMIHAKGQFNLRNGGFTTFICNSDDGFLLSIDGDIVGESGNRNRSSSSIIEIELSEGIHDLEFSHWENTGGAGVTLMIYRGIGEAPDFAFTAAREPETNPIESYWELLGAFGGGQQPFLITDVVHNGGATPSVDLTWTSQQGESFTVETNTGLTGDWEEVTDGIASGGETTTFNVPLPGPDTAELYLRVRKE